VIAQNDAAVQNEAMIAATVETGQRNMAALEQAVIKDNTLMPGEWYGGSSTSHHALTKAAVLRLTPS